MAEIELVCFDLGGVLIRLVTGWEHAVKNSGISVPEVGMMMEGWERHEKLVRELEVGEIDEPAYLKGLLECFPGVAREDFLKAFDGWLLGSYSGVEELVKELQQAGKKTACLSNTNVRHWRALYEDRQYAGILKLDYLLASHLIGCRKPDEIAYRTLERETGVEAGRILFFDDREENIEGARRAGWVAERIDPGRDGVKQVRGYLGRHGVLGVGGD